MTTFYRLIGNGYPADEWMIIETTEDDVERFLPFVYDDKDKALEELDRLREIELNGS